ncbi:alpha-N-arabinofuranosidase [Sphingomonas sp.]|jgi:alpha-N-arabinofuranosidase|uniref:alpha-N-arabinofuranosidase n=1 Tax=Sphingomonas sp. TaxID=28214 RepID=UPI002ED8E623
MKLLKHMLLPALAMMALAAPAAAQAPAQATLTVDMEKPGAKIEPAVYGQFAEHLGRGIYEGIWVGEKSPIPNTNGYRNDVTAALKKLKVPVIRWPGGCFADEYDWRDGIGPRDKRPIRVNNHWGGVTEDNAFGTHEFMNYSEMVGADAYVAGNMGSGTPREMAQWVEYMMHTQGSLAEERKRNGREQPWKIKYFGVGNESWGCGGSMRAEYSADLHRRYQEFIKTPVGAPKVIKVATGANAADYNFTEVLMREARNRMQALSMHYYTLPTGKWNKKGAATGFTEAEWASTLSRAIFMEELVSKHAAVMDKYDPQKRVALYVDEWGTWYDQEAGSTPGFLYQQNSLRDAHVAALTLNIFHRHTDRVKLTAIAQMVNVLQAMILTDKEKMLLTPTYHIFEMYQPFQGATPYPATVQGPAYANGEFSMAMVDASVARGADGKLYVALVNVDPSKPARVTTALTGKARGRIITGPSIDTHNTFDKPNTIQPGPYAGTTVNGKLVFDLPAKSVAVVMVE